MRQLFNSIASWTTTLVNHTENNLFESALRLTYLLQAKQRGWLALDGSLRLKALRDSFLSQFATLTTFSAFHFVGDTEGVNGGALAVCFDSIPGGDIPQNISC